MLLLKAHVFQIRGVGIQSTFIQHSKIIVHLSSKQNFTYLEFWRCSSRVEYLYSLDKVGVPEKSKRRRSPEWLGGDSVRHGCIHTWCQTSHSKNTGCHCTAKEGVKMGGDTTSLPESRKKGTAPSKQLWYPLWRKLIK